MAIKINAAARLMAAYRKVETSSYAANFYKNNGFKVKELITDSSYADGWGAHARKNLDDVEAHWVKAAEKLCHDFKEKHPGYWEGTFDDKELGKKWHVAVTKSKTSVELRFTLRGLGSNSGYVSVRG